KTEGMKKWKHSQETIFLCEPKNLVQLIDIRADIVVGQHHSFGIPRATARETRCKPDSSSPAGIKIALNTDPIFSSADGLAASSSKKRVLQGIVSFTF